MGNRVLQVIITIVIVIVFWNMMDYILDEFIFRQGYVFDPYYDLALPVLVGLAVELFPKKNPPQAKNGKASKGKKTRA